MRDLACPDAVLIKIISGALIFNESGLHYSILIKIAKPPAFFYETAETLAVIIEHGDFAIHIHKSRHHIPEVIEIVPVPVDLGETYIEFTVFIIVKLSVICINPHIDTVIGELRHFQNTRIRRIAGYGLLYKLEPSRGRTSLIMHSVRSVHNFHYVVINIHIDYVFRKPASHDIVPRYDISVCHIIPAVDVLVDRTYGKIIGHSSPGCPVRRFGVNVGYILMRSPRIACVVDPHQNDYGGIAADIVIDLRHRDIAHPVQTLSDFMSPDTALIPYSSVQVFGPGVADDDHLSLIRIYITAAKQQGYCRKN